MKATRLFAALAVGVFSLSSHSATQGFLGATSNGSFTNTFDASSSRQVQVLNLVDAVMTPTAVNVWNAFGVAIPGKEDTFCVVDTTGGAVSLTFTSAKPGGDGLYKAVAAGQTDIDYHFSVGLASSAAADVNVNLMNHPVGMNAFTVPAGVTVTAAGNCPAGGNVRKSIVRFMGTALPPGSAIWVDTVTVTATPI